MTVTVTVIVMVMVMGLLVLLSHTQVEQLKAALVARDNQLDQVFLYDPSKKFFFCYLSMAANT